MDYGKEKKQLKGEKSRRNLFMVFMCEVAVLILIGVIFIFGYSKYFDDNYATSEEFKEMLTNEGYDINDITEDYDNEMLKLYYFAKKENNNLGVHYIVTDDKNTGLVLSSILNSFNVSLENTFKETFFVNLFDYNYNYYSFETNGQYYVVINNQNTVFSATGESKYKDDINQIIENLGFAYPGNIIYLICFTVLFVFILIYIVLWKLFVKAGVKGWKSLITFYNLYCLSKIAFNKGWYFIFMLITPINLIFILILFYKLAKRFNKSTLFAVLSIFFPYITMQIIAFDSSKYNQPKMINNDNPKILSDNKEIKEVKQERNVGKKAINAFKWFLTIVLLLLSAIILLAYLYEKLIGYLVLAIMFLIYGLMACPTVSECTKKYKTYTKFKTLIILLLIIINIVLFAVLPF